MKDIAIEYLGGSGFLVSLGDTGLLFDASETGPDKRSLPSKETLAAFEKLYVFVSHHHDDHFSPTIYDLCGEKATYILGFDIPEPHRGVRMAPGDERGFGALTVHAYGSTDEGVSFYVNFAGITLFHAGDLNFWHWREESTVKEIEEADDAFRQAVEPIAREKIDLAFFPVDARQGLMYDAGANYFIMCVKPRLLIPMHFWGRAEIAMEFARRSRCRQTEVMALTRYGEQISLDFTDDGYIDVSLLTPPEVVVSSRTAPIELPVVELSEPRTPAYDPEDPFSDTDLPVDIK